MGPVADWNAHAAACARMAIALHRKMRPTDPLDLDDIASLVRETLLRIHDETPDLPPRVLYARTWKQAGWRLIREIDDARLPLAAADNLKRRLNTLRQTQRRLEGELGPPPTSQQLLEAHNRQVDARRKDPARQGAYATPQDLPHLEGAVSLDAVLEGGPACVDDLWWSDARADLTRGLSRPAAAFTLWWLETARADGRPPSRRAARARARGVGLCQSAIEATREAAAAYMDTRQAPARKEPHP